MGRTIGLGRYVDIPVNMMVVHLELAQANAFVAEYHRHHKPVTGHRFSIGASVGEKLVGAAIVGRPVAPNTDQWATVEVTRLCTDGTPNACSFLYGAVARAAKALGYKRIQTFVLEEEPGTSLKATGWSISHTTGGDTWNRRPGRKTSQPTGPKILWFKELQ